MISYEVDNSFAIVGARQDIDEAFPRVFVTPDRREDDDNQFELAMTPKVARTLARRLKKWADLVDPPAKRKRS